MLGKQILILEEQVEELRLCADYVNRIKYPDISESFSIKCNSFIGSIYEEIEEINMKISTIVLNNNL